MTDRDGKYRVDPVYGCHLWRRVNRDGYGIVKEGGGDRLVYKRTWEAEHGPVPDGHQLDHVCRRPACVRLEHLELVTARENNKRRSWRYRSQIRACPRGHSYALHGVTTHPEGGRVCRICSGLARR